MAELNSARKTAGVPSSEMQASQGIIQSLKLPFLPSKIAGLELWLDADDSDTLTINGSDVITWTDKSTSSNDVTQPTASFRPTISSGIQNGRNGVEFDGNDNYLLLDSTPSLNGNIGEVFVVYKTDQLDYSGRLFATCTSSATEGGTDFAASSSSDQSPDNPGPQVTDSDPVGADTLVIGETTPLTTTEAFIAHFTSDGADWAISINNIVQGLEVRIDNTGNWFGDRSPDRLSIGAAAFSTTVLFYDGKIFEILVYDGVNLTSGQRQDVHTYLANKWGVTI